MANKQSLKTKANIKVQDLKTRKDAKGGLLSKTDPYKEALYESKYGTTTTTTTKTSSETILSDPKLVP